MFLINAKSYCGPCFDCSSFCVAVACHDHHHQSCHFGLAKSFSLCIQDDTECNVSVKNETHHIMYQQHIATYIVLTDFLLLGINSVIVFGCTISLDPRTHFKLHLGFSARFKYSHKRQDNSQGECIHVKQKH